MVRTACKPYKIIHGMKIRVDWYLSRIGTEYNKGAAKITNKNKKLLKFS